MIKGKNKAYVRDIRRPFGVNPPFVVVDYSDYSEHLPTEEDYKVVLNTLKEKVPDLWK